MAEGKKSFILYTDLLATIEKLPDEIAGKLFKIILEYTNDLNPVFDDLLLQIAFEPIKLQLKRDLKSWGEFREKQSKNGKLGGRPKSHENPENPSLILETQKSLTVTVNDTVTVNEIKNKQGDKPPVYFNFKKQLIDYGFESKLVDDWLRVRKNKKATNSQTAFEDFIREFEKKEKPDKNEILRQIVSNSWSGFKWTWLEKDLKNTEIIPKAIKPSTNKDYVNS